VFVADELNIRDCWLGLYVKSESYIADALFLFSYSNIIKIACRVEVLDAVIDRCPKVSIPGFIRIFDRI
jgi:hypothetical protein